MVTIEAQTHTLLSKVPVGWSNNLGENLIPVTRRKQAGENAPTVGNGSHRVYTAEACI